jgi:hypothetical protein
VCVCVCVGVCVCVLVSENEFLSRNLSLAGTLAVRCQEGLSNPLHVHANSRKKPARPSLRVEPGLVRWRDHAAPGWGVGGREGSEPSPGPAAGGRSWEPAGRPTQSVVFGEPARAVQASSDRSAMSKSNEPPRRRSQPIWSPGGKHIRFKDDDEKVGRHFHVLGSSLVQLGLQILWRDCDTVREGLVCSNG